jgi:hypothetical protein
MRVLMTVQMDTDKANAAITDHALPAILKSVFDRIKPEAAYFGTKEGMRTGYIVFDLHQASDIPMFAEPFFQRLGARIDLIPVMNFDDAKAGLENIGTP